MTPVGSGGFGPTYPDLTKSVRGYNAAVGVAITVINLFDYLAVAYVPSDATPFGLVDLVIKNHGTVTDEFRLYNGATQVAEWHLAAGASLALAFLIPIPFNAAVGASSSSGNCEVTVVGVQP